MLYRPELWGMILAGGDGLRLRPLTVLIAGDERPKQFCRVVGEESLFDWTRRRAALLIDPPRTVLVLSRAHKRFYSSLVREVPSPCLAVQPQNRGTAPAILYGLLRISAAAPMATVAILPSDHYTSDDGAFMSHVASACAAVSERPDLVILLGINPENAEVEYGWIEPGERLPVGRLRRVRRFWEKPTSAVAQTLLDRGCLWNSLVLVARVPALLAMIRHTLPAPYAAFASAQAMFGSPRESAALERLYAGLVPMSFSESVLSASPANLAVLTVEGVGWSDWGHPQRVLATLEGLGIQPAWAASLQGARS